MGENDVFLWVTSIEWGNPDKCSFTSRYIHMFDEDRDNKKILNNLTVTVSPGLGGARLGIGYENILSKGSFFGVDLLSELRAVLLRTWGNPVSAQRYQTYSGVELRTSVQGILNFGAGVYAPLSGANSDSKSFWALHAGIGI